MSITRLQQARQMYALGQRVGGIMGSNNGSMLVTPTRDGSRPGYYGPDAGHENDPGHGSNAPGGGNGGDRPTMADIAGPVTGPVDMSHFGDTGDIVQADFTSYNQRPDTITSFKDNYAAQKKAMGLLNFLPGAQIYNIGKTALQTSKARDLLGFEPTVGPDFTGGDGESTRGLYATTNQYTTPTPIEEEGITTINPDFIQRFMVKEPYREAKGLDFLAQNQAIANMISKLYT
jgi:hypothetical protein